MSNKKTQKAKNQAMKANSEDSLNSKTGYKDTGNDAEVQFEARALRNGDNGSH